MKNAIKQRISVRSYKREPLSKMDRQAVQTILDEFKDHTGPFGHAVEFFLVDNGTNRDGKIGTYGFIKNPPSFIGGIVKNTTQGMVDFGFLMEQVILRLTELNLGTVWLGGTYNRSDFDIEVGPNEIIAAVSPVGYPTTKSIRERIIRGFAKGDKRKPFDELFFPVMELNKIDSNHKYYPYLKAIQVAPSASNKQPWRIVVANNTFHFYLERTRNYGNILVFDIQAIDMGIALSHLYLSLLEDGYQPQIVENNPNMSLGWDYIISVTING